jgi:general secretion pathway protein F
MPTFFYQAKRGPEQTEKGTIEAENQDQAISRLIQEGLVPIEVKLQTDAAPRVAPYRRLNIVRKRLGLKELNIFTQQLRSLTRSKVELLSSLKILHEQADNQALKKIILDLQNTVKDGLTFSAALNKHPYFFSSLYVDIIRSGEASGRLDEALGQLADFLEKEQDTKTKIRSALAYPVLMIIVGAATVFILFSFVIPRLVGMYEDFQTTLPLPTRILIKISTIFKQAWFLIIVLFSAVIFFFRKKGSKEHSAIDWLKLNLPLLGKLNKKTAIARFSRTLGLLLRSGIPVFQSLQIAISTLENKILIQKLESVPKDVMSGSSLSQSLKKIPYFEPFLVQMITVGEEGGRLEEVLNEVADSLTRETEALTKVITSLIEPLVILFLGLILGGIVMAMLLPIFEINMLVR